MTRTLRRVKILRSGTLAESQILIVPMYTCSRLRAVPGEDVHKVILNTALQEVPEVIRLGKEFLDGLYRGVVEPDKLADEVKVCRGREGRSKEVREVCSRGIAKHHGDDEVVERLINYYYLLSLYHYRRRDPHLSGITLGRALHYIQDSSFTYTGVGEHKVQEERMKEVIARGVDLRNLCREVSVELSMATSDPVKSLCVMYRRSVDALNQFISEASKTVTEEVSRKSKQFKRKQTLGAIGLLLAVLMIFVSPLLVTFFLDSAVLLILAFILSIILSFIILKIYESSMSALERDLAKLGLAKPHFLLEIYRTVEGEKVTITPAY
jgi:hypothetical protein